MHWLLMLAGTVISLCVIYIFRPTDIFLSLDLRRGPIRLPPKVEEEEGSEREPEGELEEGTPEEDAVPEVFPKPKRRRHRPNRRRMAQKLRAERQRAKQNQWLRLLAEDDEDV